MQLRLITKTSALQWYLIVWQATPNWWPSDPNVDCSSDLCISKFVLYSGTDSKSTSPYSCNRALLCAECFYWASFLSKLSRCPCCILMRKCSFAVIFIMKQCFVSAQYYQISLITQYKIKTNNLFACKYYRIVKMKTSFN